jgi:hypothetical protein
MHCTGPCQQGRIACPTPTACGAELGGGSYFLPREQASERPYFALRNDHDEFFDEEPMSDFAVACWAVAICSAIALVVGCIAVALARSAGLLP